jgi:hypothetical protein
MKVERDDFKFKRSPSGDLKNLRNELYDEKPQYFPRVFVLLFRMYNQNIIVHNPIKKESMIDNIDNINTMILLVYY